MLIDPRNSVRIAASRPERLTGVGRIPSRKPPLGRAVVARRAGDRRQGVVAGPGDTCWIRTEVEQERGSTDLDDGAAVFRPGAWRGSGCGVFVHSRRVSQKRSVEEVERVWRRLL